MTKNIYIGIDPDVSKSGVAFWDKGKDNITALGLLSFFQLFYSLKKRKDSIALVVIEAGWLNTKSNYHNRNGQTKVIGERIAKNVGANHETGKKIVEMCEYLGLPYRLVKPTKTKTTPALFKKITGIDEKNQEKIDAALLVYKL